MPRKIIRTISDVLKDYDLELDKLNPLLAELNKKKSYVLLQFPDGLKIHATTIVDYLTEKFTNITFLLWMDSCFGACDIPVLNKVLEKTIDLVVQFGHVAWHNRTPIWEPTVK